MNTQINNKSGGQKHLKNGAQPKSLMIRKIKINTMKKIAYFLLFAVLLASCTSVKQIGKVNMISNRNVDPQLKYQVITTYSGGSSKEFKKSRATSIEDAVDQTVRKVPGGEFVMNAKIYLVKGKYIAVEGDVWGNSAQQSYRGFKIGDIVTWKVKSVTQGKKYLTGKITTLKDDKTCLVKIDDEKGKTIELEYDEITKTDN